MFLNDIYQSIDPVAFSILGRDIRWYGIAYLIGFALAGICLWFTARKWKFEKFNFDALMIVITLGVFGVIIGARLGYVLVYNPSYYMAHPTEILFSQMGGMSFHGGLVGALIAGGIASRMLKMPFLSLVDATIIGAPLGLFFGRCANFINGELWGATTDVPWGVIFGGSAGLMPRHPSQLYEAVLEGLVIFIVLFILSRRNTPLPRGTYTGVFCVMYGIFRFGVEFVRQPDAQLGYLLGTNWLTMGQILSAPVLIVGVALLVYALKTNHPQQGPEFVPHTIGEMITGEPIHTECVSNESEDDA